MAAMIFRVPLTVRLLQMHLDIERELQAFSQLESRAGQRSHSSNAAMRRHNRAIRLVVSALTNWVNIEYA